MNILTDYYEIAYDFDGGNSAPSVLVRVSILTQNDDPTDSDILGIANDLLNSGYIQSHGSNPAVLSVAKFGDGRDIPLGP